MRKTHNGAYRQIRRYYIKENLGWRDARQQVWLDSDERNAEYNLPPIPPPIAALIATQIAALGAAYPETETYSHIQVM